jgi:hypothetical protein
MATSIDSRPRTATSLLSAHGRVRATMRGIVACVLCATSACSQAPGAGNAVDPAGAAPSASVCGRKLITAQDVAGLFKEPIAGSSNVPGDAQSCEFKTAGFSSLTISVRPGHGRAAVGMYTSGKMDEYDKSAPLAGVGDAAVHSLLLNRVVARKDDLLCEITGPGPATAVDDPALRALGALCNRIFAAY